MDPEAERLDDESARCPVFERSRTSIAWLTAAMTAISVFFALVGLHLGTRYVDRQAAVSPVMDLWDTAATDGETQAPEPEFIPRTGPGPTVVELDETDPASPTTRSGAAASSSVPEPGSLESESSSPPAESNGVTTTTASTVTGHAPSAGGSDPRASAQERGQRALDRIGYPWTQRLPGWSVEFHEERDGLYGLTMVDDKRIEIYVRGNQSDDLLAHIVAHEIGHAVDVTLNDGDDRRRWQEARAIEDEPWWPDAAASDFRTGAGDFAEGFAYWQVRSGNYRSKLGPAPDEAQLRLMAELANG